MKKKIIGIFVCMLLLIPVLSMSVVADPGAKLNIQIFGGLPFFFGLRNVGGAIGNIGDDIAHNVSYNFTMKGGFNDLIDYSFEDYFGNIPPNGSVGIATDAVNGFGLVTITLSATSSNAGNVTKTRKGFQIGYFTWVPMSWFGLFFLLINFIRTIIIP